MFSDWQHLPAQISPNLFAFGAFQIRYYSLMYLVAFALTYFLVLYRIKKEHYDYSAETIQDCFMWLILGLVIGARLGYVLFYNFSYYLGHPLEIFLPFCRRRRINFWRLADLFAPAIPLGYTFGRIGNFINGELYGRATSVSWGMIFPLDPLQVVRHPSQLYEAFFEGLVLFAVLWTIRKRSPFDGFLLALYLMGYGLVRFFIEFYREPDAHVGFIWVSLTTGQALCLLMMAAGMVILIWRHYAVGAELAPKKRRKNTGRIAGKT
jgi:phosphatidylglycerol:prolipoprotein diacylglycerol transferase